MTVAKKILVRLLAYVLLTVVMFWLVDATGMTEDALAGGLAIFLAYVVVGFGWAAVDGFRAATQALLVWVVVSPFVGLILQVGVAVTDSSAASGVRAAIDLMIFMLFLVGIPALIGVGIGAVVRVVVNSARTSENDSVHA